MSAKSAPPRLGRGLAALLGEPAAPAAPAAVAAPAQTLPVAALEVGPFQPRRDIDPASMAELVESIRARGVLQPILARHHPTDPNHYQIIAGERRWRASQQAGLHEIPVLVRDLSDSEAMAAALVENLQRQDLNPIEEAEGYRRLLDEFGLSQEELGEAVGKSRSHIANTLRLRNLPPGLQAQLRNGALTAGHARALLSHPDPEAAARAVIARGLNVRQTEAMARQATGPEPSGGGATRARDPDTEAVERDLSERLGLRVQIAHAGRGGTLRIHYQSLDQLDGLIALLRA
jgi:ParB family transcriptional regulator, chromosome partitioning protein